MDITINREVLLRPLQLVANAVDRKQALPILGNLLLQADDSYLSLTGTDLEVEMVAKVPIEALRQQGATTVSAKKLLDIVRNLPDGSDISFKLEPERLVVKAGRSRFSLATLAVADYPRIDDWQPLCELTLAQGALKRLLDRTTFSMAVLDVRYFLNGLLLELDGQYLNAVATDGHRLAMARLPYAQHGENRDCILPRKGCMELAKLLDSEEASVQIALGDSHLRAQVAGFSLTSKLVDGKFPDYRRVVPRGLPYLLEAERDALRQALSRAAILSNEKVRGIRFAVSGDELTIAGNNPDQEEALESLEVSYNGPDVEIGFNFSYLLDVLNAIPAERVRIALQDANSSAVIEGVGVEHALYVVMPLRL